MCLSGKSTWWTHRYSSPQRSRYTQQGLFVHRLTASASKFDQSSVPCDQRKKNYNSTYLPYTGREKENPFLSILQKPAAALKVPSASEAINLYQSRTNVWSRRIPLVNFWLRLVLSRTIGNAYESLEIY